jgi:hypothetical protein
MIFPRMNIIKTTIVPASQPADGIQPEIGSAWQAKGCPGFAEFQSLGAESWRLTWLPGY